MITNITIIVKHTNCDEAEIGRYTWTQQKCTRTEMYVTSQICNRYREIIQICDEQYNNTKCDYIRKGETSTPITKHNMQIWKYTDANQTAGKKEIYQSNQRGKSKFKIKRHQMILLRKLSCPTL